MNLKQVKYDDPLTNVLVRSKKFANDLQQLQDIKYDYKLNYKKVYDNPKQYQLSYVDAMANLEEIKNVFDKRINQKNDHYNFFLDNTDNPGTQKPIDEQDYKKYICFMKKGRIFAYTLSNTWTKGKQFFFIEKGCVFQVTHIHADRIFVDACYKGQTGLMKLQELKIILTDDDI